MSRLLLLITLVAWWPLQTAITVDVNLVNVFATIQDEDGRYVTDLGLDDFELYEEGELRSVDVFERQDDLPTTVGVLIDNSGSSAADLDAIKSGVFQFISTLTPADEIFVVSFATEVRTIHGFTSEAEDLPASLQGLRSLGTSLLFDALRFGTSKANDGSHPRKALVVLTDGNDNRSQSSYTAVVEDAQGGMVMLYFVAMGPRILVDLHTIGGLASITGGRVVPASSDDDVVDALMQIREEMRYQYYLGYHASSEPGYHSIRVEVPGRNVTVRAREGYLVE